MAILDWIYPKKCLGCGKRGRDICLECRVQIQRRGGSLEYTGLVRRMIKEIKYRGTYSLVSELVEIWDPARPHGEWVVSSIPMWRGKMRQRGYNQAEVIARIVAKRWGVGYVELLERVRQTRPMYGLGRGERRENVRGAFKARGLRQRSRGKGVVLVDDVWTSGATLEEGVKTLKQAGWTQVYPVALAR